MSHNIEQIPKQQCQLFLVQTTLLRAVVDYESYKFYKYSYKYSQLTIHHILVDCIEYDFIRPELFGNNTTLKDILGNVSSDDIVMFIKRAHLFSEL